MGFLITLEMLTEIFTAQQKTKNLETTPLPEFEMMDGILVQDWAEKVRRAGLITVKHGDAGQWIRKGYQNENLLFWHKDLGFVFPSNYQNYSGEVPPCFRIGNGLDDFSPNHWEKDVDGNTVYASDSIVKELQELLKSTMDALAINIRGRMHPVVGLRPEDLDEELVWFDACTGDCTCGELRR